MIKKFLSLALILVFSSIAFSQVPAEKKPTEDPDKLRKEAVAFLRETMGDVNTMRTLENRISFTAEMAGLMWFYDEREARSMYTTVIGDFRDLLGRYESEMNELGAKPAGTTPEGEFDFMSFLQEPTDHARVVKKFRVAVGVGQQISMSLAEHDPELGYSFYYDSISSIANKELREEAEKNGTYFESQLLKQIAETNPGKAAQLGAKAVGKGVLSQHVSLLEAIYGKDPDKAADYGAVLLGRLKDKKIEATDHYVMKSLLQFGGRTLEDSRKPGGKRPVYSQAELRDLAELLAQSILNLPSGVGDATDEFSVYADVVQPYVPGRAAQIRTKFPQKASKPNSNAQIASQPYGDPNMGSAVPPPPMATIAGTDANPARELEQKLEEDVKNLATKQLSKEERDKIVAQARKILMQTPGREKKITGLSMLAAQVAKLGDKELAGEIMRDAERLVNPSPKTYLDFLRSWMLATGYAWSEPDKAFPILQETIGRANDTLSAFIKVGEFVDVAEEMIVDGEVQVGAFGGQMVRGMTKELGLADSTIQMLARADFAKTKLLPNGFDRAEVRVLAKMLILRAVLQPKKEPKPDEKIDVVTDDVTDK